MPEPIVATVMSRSPVVVTPELTFKQVACALLASDAGVVPVVHGRVPVGVITENDVLLNLEFHGGLDPAPLILGSASRRRRRKACATTASELMSSPAPTIACSAGLSDAVRRLATPGSPALCVIDEIGQLAGLLARRDLLAIYRRSDDELAAEIKAAVERDRSRPAREPAELAVHVEAGAVRLEGALTYRSQVEHAVFAASRVAGVIAVHSNLTYDIDDMLVTGF
ncbi:CBS domain-containing protein [Kribbella sp. NBC_00889]|uniref:CBS domain-containing protein n=1 Tax=Kribbella sp. NBC_00889 TaxID=2975974 RepID=UPI0038695FD4|nr:CBS domain-containing protein [Kribbella sp. NBC_00889]